MMENEKCALLIIPFPNRKMINELERIHDLNKFARNVLEVDDNFYEDILKRYKKFKYSHKKQKARMK